MTDDQTQGTKPNKESGKIAVDDMGIPILEEVFTQQSTPNPIQTAPNTPDVQKTNSTQETTEIPKAPGHNFSLPNNEILVTALRNQLRSQINKDINEIAAEVSGNIVASITRELELKVKTELIEILQRNLDDMINHAISVNPKRES